MTRWDDTEPIQTASSFRSVPDLWRHRVDSTPDGEALIHRSNSGWTTLTWRQADRRVRTIANGLLHRGVTGARRVVILASTRLEWILADLAVLHAGAATTTVYPSSTAEDCAFILAHAEAVVAFVENHAQVEKLRSVRDRLPELAQVVVFDGSGSEDGWVVTLADFENDGRRFAEANPTAFRDAHENLGPDDLATLIYTSGTTGPPKGVRLSHDSWIYEGEAMDLLGVMSPADRQLLFLPLSHVFAKVLVIAFIRLGMPTVVDGDAAALQRTLVEQRPTWMAGVPRVFEKMQERILTEIDTGGFLARRVFEWALKIGRQVSDLQLRGKSPSGSLRAKHALADRLVFRPIRERFGGRIRFFISGGAPLSPDIGRFFHAMGILVLEGWGLTESSGASCVNTPDAVRFGTVGRPMPGAQIRIAEDGEILLKSRGVMQGYHNDPKETERVLVDGWLLTGDIGDKLPSGHIQITDRKKDLIITAGGKNVAPTNVQQRLTARCPYVADAIMLGDRRPYCTLLVTLAMPALAEWAKREGLRANTYAQLAQLDVVRALIQAHIDEVNQDLPSYERVKRFAILPAELSLESGTLTPSMKVKRREVERRYAGLIDGLYAGGTP